jgi:hypothetical protein
MSWSALDDLPISPDHINHITPANLEPVAAAILNHAHAHNYIPKYTSQELMDINSGNLTPAEWMTSSSSSPTSLKKRSSHADSLASGRPESAAAHSTSTTWTQQSPVQKGTRVEAEISLETSHAQTQTESIPSTTSVPNHTTDGHKDQSGLTALQQHVLFWDRDNDGIIHPWDVYRGFRELGFNVLFSLGSLLIPLFFSYPTTLGHSWLPDPWFRIWVADMHKAKHGSDTGIFDVDGHFHADRFDEMFDRWDGDRCGGLSAHEMCAMWKKNRCAADPAGWSFAFMEMWTTWLLLQKDGRVWKDDLRACYEGTLFWNISERRQQKHQESWDQGYGVNDFLEGLWKGRTWKSWQLKKD